MADYLLLFFIVCMLAQIAAASVKIALQGELGGWIFFCVSLSGLLSTFVRLPGHLIVPTAMIATASMIAGLIRHSSVPARNFQRKKRIGLFGLDFFTRA